MTIALPQLLLTHSNAQDEKRSMRGKIYFSNNTPNNVDDFPVELLTSDQNSIVVATTLTESGEFYLENLAPGRFVLRITQPGQCFLLYRADLRRRSITNTRIVMDAECAHTNGKLSDLPQ